MGMEAIAGDLLAPLDAVDTIDELAAAMTLIATRLRFDHFALAHHGDGSDPCGPTIRLDNCPARWTACYHRLALELWDPVHRASQVTCAAFRWSELPDLIPLTPHDRRFLDLARAAGIGGGYTVPANVPGETTGSCSFMVGVGRPIPTELLPLAQAVGTVAFDTARRLMRPRPLAMAVPALAPGDKLEPVALADQLGSSATPVRDALHRLTGERLVEARPSEGFHVTLINEPALRDLYAWNTQLLRMMIRSWPRSPMPPLANDLPIDLERATPVFFALFAARTGNAEFAVQVDDANDRLSTARIAERRVLMSLEAELRALAIEFDRDDRAALVKRLSAYHRRRAVAVPEIVRALYRG